MIRTLLILVFATITVYGDCSLITDNTLKNFCKAEITNQPVYCSFIEESDIKHYCFALINKSNSYCNLISNSDYRNYCNIKVKNKLYNN